MSRPPWDEYLMSFAVVASKRGTCDRKQVGAVIVQLNRVVATGYNGSVAGMPHCDDAGHDMVEGHCIRTIHAEMNALAQAAKFGAGVEMAAIYTTASPCWACFRVLVNAGIKTFVYAEPYRYDEDHLRIKEVAERLVLIVRQLDTIIRVEQTPEEFQALKDRVAGDCDPVDLLGCAECGVPAGTPCKADCTSG